MTALYDHETDCGRDDRTQTLNRFEPVFCCKRFGDKRRSESTILRTVYTSTCGRVDSGVRLPLQLINALLLKVSARPPALLRTHPPAHPPGAAAQMGVVVLLCRARPPGQRTPYGRQLRGTRFRYNATTVNTSRRKWPKQGKAAEKRPPTGL